jgi:hypothetical protein
VQRDRHPALPAALAVLEERLRDVAGSTRAEPRSAFGRDFEPVQQVTARGELAGPRGLRAGVDVRGDGSAEAWTGRLRRRVVAREPGEDAYAALRRAVTAG